LETIGHNLRGLGEGLDRVQHAAAGAGQRAEDIAGRAAALGTPSRTGTSCNGWDGTAQRLTSYR
jgi:hypothetical protein